MLSSPDLSFSRNLPLAVFNQLGELLQQMASSLGNTGLVLTEAVLVRVYIPKEWQNQRFTVVVSEHFSVLLRGNLEQGSREENYNQHSVLSTQYPVLNTHTSTSLSEQQAAQLPLPLTALCDINTKWRYNNTELYSHNFVFPVIK